MTGAGHGGLGASESLVGEAALTNKEPKKKKDAIKEIGETLQVIRKALRLLELIQKNDRRR